MKKIIILGWCGGMGGGNIYTRNLCVVAKKLGWTPIVFHFSKKQTFISDLKQFDNNRVLEMKYPPCYYSARQREFIINKFLNVINPQPNDEFFIQSNGIRYSYWGELLAKSLNCKHFTFLLEAYYALNDDYYDYFNFKLNRKELAGIRQESLPLLFGDYLTVSESDNIFYKAFCTNSVEDIPFSNKDFDFSSYDIVIGNIGRSTKLYVLSAINELVSFANSHPDKSILFIIIGGETNTYEDRLIKETIQNCRNLQYYATGFLFPIPRELLYRMDVALASGGCIKIALEAGVRTIAFKDNETEPYGVCGYDLKEDWYSQEKPLTHYTLKGLIEDVLFNNFCSNYEYTPLFPSPNYEASWKLLEETVTTMLAPVQLSHYDTTKVLPKSFWRRMYIKTIGRVVPFSMIVKWFYERSK